MFIVVKGREAERERVPWPDSYTGFLTVNATAEALTFNYVRGDDRKHHTLEHL